MALTLEQLLASPDHYLYAFEDDEAIFVAMDRAGYRRSIFLDHRISLAAEGSVRLPLAELIEKLPFAQPTGWIFHVAHCGSTLLARALEALGETLVLREPLAMRQLGLAPDPARLKLAMALLARRYLEGSATLIKANVPVNFILGEIAAADETARTLFLYCQLEDYLLAILRSANHRAWLRRVTGQLAGHFEEHAQLSDGELGAALWLAQMRRFAGAIERMPNASSLDAERFFAEPAEVLVAAAKHFLIPTSAAAIEAVAGGPLFRTYSKNPTVEFDNAARVARQQALKGVLAGEIAMAQRWLAGAAPDISAVMDRITGAALIG